MSDIILLPFAGDPQSLPPPLCGPILRQHPNSFSTALDTMLSLQQLWEHHEPLMRRPFVPIPEHDNALTRRRLRNHFPGVCKPLLLYPAD